MRLVMILLEMKLKNRLSEPAASGGAISLRLVAFLDCFTEDRGGLMSEAGCYLWGSVAFLENILILGTFLRRLHCRETVFLPFVSLVSTGFN